MSNSILLLDAILGESRGDSSSFSALEVPGARRAQHVPCSGRFDAILVADHGTLDCVEALREAISYRRKNPDCLISVLRRVGDESNDTDAVLKSLAPRAGTKNLSIPADALPRFVSGQNDLAVLISDDGVLFEYAA